MSVSVVLNSLPSDRELWRPFIEHLRGIQGITECKLSLPAAGSIDDEAELDELFALRDEFFTVWQPVEEYNVAQRLNLIAAEAAEETLLFLEKPFWLRVQSDSEAAWYQLREQRGIRPISRYVANCNSELVGPDSSSALPFSNERLGQAFLIQKKHFMEMRGYDEHEQFCAALGFDFFLRQKRGGFDFEKPANDIAALV